MTDTPYGPDYGALIAALGRRVAALEARLQRDDRKDALRERVREKIATSKLGAAADSLPTDAVDERIVGEAVTRAMGGQTVRTLHQRDAATDALDDAVARACEAPTLVDALSWIAVWENDRAVRQALLGERGADGRLWDTCFRHCFAAVFASYEKPKPEEPAERCGECDAAEAALERARNLAREWLSDRNTGPYGVCQETRDCGRQLLAALETERSD